MSADAQQHYAELGEGCVIQPGATVGLRYKDGCEPAVLGDHVTIRSGSVIYADVTIGEDCQTGHNVMIREKTNIGNHVVVGTNTVIDGYVDIGDFVKIESACYIPTHVTIGSRVFFGPGVVLTNDRYPLKDRDSYRPEGPVIEDGVTIGAGVVVSPGVRIGAGAFIAAGAVVTKDVEPGTLIKGVPGRAFPMPDKLKERNMALSWRPFLEDR